MRHTKPFLAPRIVRACFAIALAGLCLCYTPALAQEETAVKALWEMDVPPEGGWTVGDLIPMRRLKTHATTLFAVGVALGVVQRERTGRYIAPRGNNRSIRLSAQKERSAALMGMDASTCREVERRLNHLLTQEGPARLRSRLDEYTASTASLADWEISNISSFSRNIPEEQPQAES